jgi:GTP-binding protein
LKVLSAEFVTSAAAQGRGDGIPADGIAHVAFAGRSNVGKSTLLNALARRTLARTSAAPGKTRLANIFLLHVEGGPGGPGRWRVYFVDLPGYGYARGGADSAKELAAVAQAYYGSGCGMRDAGSGGERRRRAGLGEIGPRPAPGPRVSDPGQPVPDPGAEPAKRATLLLIDSRHPGLASDLLAHQWLTSVAGPPQIVATKIDKLSRSDRARNLKELERVFGTPPLPVSAAGGEGLDALWKVIARVAREQRP